MAGTLDDDLRLSDGSNAIDAGSNDLLPQDSLDLDHDGDRAEPLPVDLVMHARTFGTADDMGAYETDAPPVNLARERVLPDAADEVVVYPNPAQDRFWVVTRVRGHRRIDLYDLLGRKVAETGCRPGDPVCRVEVSRYGLASGVYFIRLSSGGIGATSSIVIER
jgi:hypothetical protein